MGTEVLYFFPSTDQEQVQNVLYRTLSLQRRFQDTAEIRMMNKTSLDCMKTRDDAYDAGSLRTQEAPEPNAVETNDDETNSRRS